MKDKLEQDSIERSLVPQDLDDFHLGSSDVERRHKFQEVLKNILPYLGSDEGKIVLAQIMITLKLEGIIGKSLTSRDEKMLKVIKEAIMSKPSRKREALRNAYKLLR